MTWAPLDLSGIIDAVANGLDADNAPSVVRRTDGPGLFYSGEVNGIHGASGSGKTWFLLHGCAQEVLDGRHVVYVDHEGNPRGVVRRLLDLGLTADEIGGHFHYVQPEVAFHEGGKALLTFVEDWRPSLVVIDSTGEGLALHGANPNADDEVARWFQQVPRRISALGPAVGLIDHGAKASGGELWPIGSQRKLAAVTGAQFYVETLTEFSREKAGALRAICAKDRGGHFTVGRTVAVLHVTPEDDGRLSVSLTAPNPEDRRTAPESRGEAVQRELAARIVALLGDGEPKSGRAVEDGIGGNRAAVKSALDRLVSDGTVTRSIGARGAHMHQLRKVPGDLPSSPALKGRGEVREVPPRSPGGGRGKSGEAAE
ncbi:AAA family ATPase [Microbacterium sp. EYE_5]|uniref:AAA family ATPase n=1 Tax=unclassified Microbacterium TaxID=2609290 RepID=UPI002006B300|nr:MULTISPECIES: AAA family ATPase [unclassified Microbacterium]MCK6080974.1 AAA family ATPase [Microbacterium sp. EYE_382]MCK6086244.1 AAA family ATPase [Microbacterium sp. EYE_384]MCK6124258.1 AAA family ATPase [Microbacterium sp. EYE_80]MCK6127167.1 AAA family ATPase [Microbacterium sp. EYE_79]MCK6141929.1 AAA family ATPase [Microbacterium sp. EYE_39]